MLYALSRAGLQYTFIDKYFILCIILIPYLPVCRLKAPIEVIMEV